MLEENLRRWIEHARKEGLEEGQIRALQDALLAQMTFRFGRLPANVRRQIKEISSAQELLKLGRRVVRAKTLEDMGLG
jgi:hypothetical protein